jgi:hypothetical protein
MASINQTSSTPAHARRGAVPVGRLLVDSSGLRGPAVSSGACRGL